jgi:DmsE family decaheme c-type cytochrome
MSFIHLIAVLGNLTVGLLSAPAPPTDAPAQVVFPSKPVAAHAVAKTAHALPADAITKETCGTCHEEAVASFDRSEHSKAMETGGAECTACHGDATAHIDAGGGAETMTNPKTELSTQAANKVCMTCHEKTGERTHANVSEHTRAGVGCVDCHNAHPSEKQAIAAHKGGHSSMTPTSEEACLKCHSQVRAEFAMPSRHRLHEGAMSCTSCHNVHGTTSERQVRGGSKEMCGSCHKDKAQTFMFEHEAGAIDGCTSCHTPHGSAGQHMLKERDPRALCVSCHSRDMGKGVPHGRASTTTMGDCTRCHTAVHGSNVDPFLLH